MALAVAGCTRKETVRYTPDPFIADPVFLGYCETNFDFNGDGYFSKAEASEVEEVILDNEGSGGSAGVASLEGIRYFTALQRLSVPGNSIAAMDISENTLLVSLNCENNLLTELDISSNTGLMSLSCSGNSDDMVIYVWEGFDANDLMVCIVPPNAVFKAKE